MALMHFSIARLVIAATVVANVLVATQSQQLRGPSLSTHRSLLSRCPCDDSKHAVTARDSTTGLTTLETDRHDAKETTRHAHATNDDPSRQDATPRGNDAQNDYGCRQQKKVTPDLPFRHVPAKPQSRRTASSQISFNFHKRSNENESENENDGLPARGPVPWRINPPHDSQSPMPLSSIKEPVGVTSWLWPPILFPMTQTVATTTCLPTTLPTAIQSSVDSDETTATPMVAKVDSLAPMSPGPVTSLNEPPLGSPFTWLEPDESPESAAPRNVPLEQTARPFPTDSTPTQAATATVLPTQDQWQLDPHSTAEPSRNDGSNNPPPSWWDENPTSDPLMVPPVPETVTFITHPVGTVDSTRSPIETDASTLPPSILPTEIEWATDSIETTIPVSREPVPITVRPSPVPSPNGDPSPDPTISPTCRRTNDPTNVPTMLPSPEPSQSTTRPVERPSGVPSGEPTLSPTLVPTASPTLRPTLTPTLLPSARPTRGTSRIPTVEPSSVPSFTPSIDPSFVHSADPTTLVPSFQPHDQRADHVTSLPSITTDTSELPLLPTRDDVSCQAWVYQNCVAMDPVGNWNLPCKVDSFHLPEGDRLLATPPSALEGAEMYISSLSIEEQLRVRSTLVGMYQAILSQH